MASTKYLLVVFLGAYLSLGTNSEPIELTVKITNIKTIEGTVHSAIYDSPEAFPKEEQELHQEIITVKSDTVTCKFKNLSSKIYAIAIFHDANLNGKIDKNFMGIPKEGYGFSRNYKPKFRAPKFDDASINLTADTTIFINLIFQ